jgi:DNA-binding MarR family transcriptional regulator
MRQRVVHSLLQPVVRLARVLKISLRDLTQGLQLAYYRELRSEGLSMKEASGHLGISMRTASRLSKSLKTEFFRPEREHSLPRRIEFMLWATPLSRARIRQALHNESPEAVDAALDQLLEEGLAAERAGRVPTYAIVRESHRMKRLGWPARIGGLNSLMSTVADTVYARFFGESSPVLARTLLLRVRTGQLQRLEEIYETQIYKALAQLDAEASDDPLAVPMSVSVCWAPRGILPTNDESAPRTTGVTI